MPNYDSSKTYDVKLKKTVEYRGRKLNPRLRHKIMGSALSTEAFADKIDEAVELPEGAPAAQQS